MDMEIAELKSRIKGDVDCGLSRRLMYSTDASAYDEMPLGVVYPRDASDIVEIVRFAGRHGINLIPRATGTSLAGQVVGKGLVVDVSRYMNSILEVNEKERWVRVQPGVVLDELNIALEPYGLFFGPETSTSNRCCIGGMAGNNSCGSHSLVYGNTRDNLLEARVVLSDGSEALFGPLDASALESKCALPSLEGRIYSGLFGLLDSEENRNTIKDNYPLPAVKRRNTGYALDELADASCFDASSRRPFNVCRLLAGSEGTLAFSTELKLNLVPVPPRFKCVICVHCTTLWEAFDVNLVALDAGPSAVELIDHNILELSKGNITQAKNRFFVEGEPQALVVIEIDKDSREELDKVAREVIDSLKEHKLGYAYPVVEGDKIKAVWALRKAGLGLLNGMPGSKKPVPVIEDTAIDPRRAKAFHQELKKVLDGYGISCVYYAHIGSGELHLRPILNLKNGDDRSLFREVAQATARLVRKYRGSMSGEHGDGRLRGELIPLVLGEEVYGMIRDVKTLFDPEDIFNQGKIVDTPEMNRQLRARHCRLETMETYFDFSKEKGFICAIEQCNGTGECRKSSLFGGVMCPSFRATRDEGHCTRARANLLRELLLRPAHPRPFSQPEILGVLSTCLSCKGCKAECPSNVDITRYKAEYLQHHYDEEGVPLRTRLVSSLPAIQKMGMIAPALYNLVVSGRITSGLIKRIMGFAPKREIPRIYRFTLRHYLRHLEKSNPGGPVVYIFADEFTNYEDVEVGIEFATMLTELGYSVRLPEHGDSGRINLSKGLLKKARRQADRNVRLLKDVITDETPLVGIEPSCILSFRDEYPALVDPSLREDARRLARNALLYDEFICREIDKGRIRPEQFTDKALHIKLHGHCHQKALASQADSQRMLSLPVNYVCDIIPSGCCGMAGAFGYEKKNYDLSMAVGEEVLFPAVREAADCVIAAPGTSCRHQIFDGTGRVALHPLSILCRALRKN